MTATTALVIAVLASPVIAAAAAAMVRRPAVDTLVSAAGVAGAIALLVEVGRDGTATSFAGWIEVDRVASVWLVFALATALTVRTFARRHLIGDEARVRVDRRSAFAATSGALLFCAGDLVALAVAAVASSIAATALVVANRPPSQLGRTMRRNLLVADAALVLAVVVTATSAGSTDLAALGATDGVATHVAAVAMVVAAIGRCALLPFHRWLPGSIAAPTPVSAMLHAGIVNAGGVVLVRAAPLVSRSTLAIVIGLAVSCFAMVVGTAAMRSRVEVKTRLVWSTTAQMGFMLVQALLGLGAAAAAHLVAHGAFKASMFLTSGSTLEHAATPTAGARRPSPAVAAATIVASALVVGAATAVSGYDVGSHDGAAVLVPIFAVATVHAVLSAAAGRRSVTAVGVTAAIVGAGITVYLGLLARLERWLAIPDTTPSGALAMTLVVALVVLAGAALTSPLRDPHARWTAVLRAHLTALTRRPTIELAAIARTSTIDRTIAPRGVS